jgi:hypothetical protein
MIVHLASGEMIANISARIISLNVKKRPATPRANRMAPDFLSVLHLLASALPTSSENAYHPRQFRVHLGNAG